MGGNATSVLIKADSEKNVEKVFKDFDKDKNGTLEKGEWLKVAQLLWKEKKKFGLDLEEYHDESTVAYFATEIFRHVDKNNDGVISFSEFWNFFKSIADGTFHFGPKNGENTGEMLSVEREYDYVLPVNEIQHLCLICKRPPSIPTMILNDNTSLFCRVCLVDELTRKNAYDESVLPVVDITDATIINYLDNLQVRCPFSWNGCPLVTSRKDSVKHCGECTYKNFRCPNYEFSGCEFTNTTLEGFKDHLTTCIRPTNNSNAIVEVNPELCKQCCQHHTQEGDNYYHTGSFNDLPFPTWLRHQQENDFAAAGKNTLTFCGRVAVVSAKNFGSDAWKITKASWHVSGHIVGWHEPRRRTTNNKGEGFVVLIGLAVGIVGSTGGLLIGAGHAIGTPFIELGKVVRSAVQPTYKNVSDCVVAWSCCGGGGSWARGCMYCNNTSWMHAKKTH